MFDFPVDPTFRNKSPDQERHPHKKSQHSKNEVYKLGRKCAMIGHGSNFLVATGRPIELVAFGALETVSFLRPRVSGSLADTSRFSDDRRALSRFNLMAPRTDCFAVFQ